VRHSANTNKPPISPDGVRTEARQRDVFAQAKRPDIKKMSPGEPVHRLGVQWAKDEFDCSRWRAIVNMALLP
jgi:hypothetical protein